MPNLIMNWEHPDWDAFYIKLLGPEGCNFHYNEEGNLNWRCDSNQDKAVALITANWSEVDIQETIAWWNYWGGYCDCEIAFNVVKPAWRAVHQNPVRRLELIMECLQNKVEPSALPPDCEGLEEMSSAYAPKSSPNDD